MSNITDRYQPSWDEINAYFNKVFKAEVSSDLSHIFCRHQSMLPTMGQRRVSEGDWKGIWSKFYAGSAPLDWEKLRQMYYVAETIGTLEGSTIINITNAQKILMAQDLILGLGPQGLKVIDLKENKIVLMGKNSVDGLLEGFLLKIVSGYHWLPLEREG